MVRARLCVFWFPSQPLAYSLSGAEPSSVFILVRVAHPPHPQLRRPPLLIFQLLHGPKAFPLLPLDVSSMHKLLAQAATSRPGMACSSPCWVFACWLFLKHLSPRLCFSEADLSLSVYCRQRTSHHSDPCVCSEM